MLLALGLVTGFLVGWGAARHVGHARGEQVRFAQERANLAQATAERHRDDLKREKHDHAATEAALRAATAAQALLHGQIAEQNSVMEKLEKELAAAKAQIEDLSKPSPASAPLPRAPRDPILGSAARLRDDPQSIYFATEQATLLGNNRYSIRTILDSGVGKPICKLVVTDVSSREEEGFTFRHLSSMETVTFGEHSYTFVLIATDFGGCTFRTAQR